MRSRLFKFVAPSIRFLWPDGIFDVTWSEVNKDSLICGTGDGKLLVVDMKVPQVHTES